MVLYFTGTGNSRFVAERIAKVTGDRVEDISVYIKSGERPIYTSTEAYVFVAPCYVSTTARAMTDFIKGASFPKGVRAYFVITAASYMGAAPTTNRKLSAKKGFKYMGTAQVAMPQNYITHFKMRSEEVNRKTVKEAIPVIDRLSAIIKRGGPLPAVRQIPGEALFTDLVCDLYYPLLMKTKKFRVTDKCISCRKCESLCPYGNISFDGEKPVWGKKCTHCMACINLCPVSAIEYGKGSVGKRRYKGPEKV